MVRSTQLLHTSNSVSSSAKPSENPLAARSGWLNGQLVQYTSKDAPFGELTLTCPEGQHLHYLDWRTNESVLLLKNVQRLTAPTRA